MARKRSDSASDRKAEKTQAIVLADTEREIVQVKPEKTAPVELRRNESEDKKELIMSTPQTTPVGIAPSVTTTPEERLKAAQHIVTINSRWAAGLGLIPLPLIDWAAITGMQVRMLHQLCKTYSIPFDQGRAVRYVGALVGGYVPTVLGYSLGSLIKAIPIVGGAAFIAVPAAAYATTYALGEVFIPFFATGGTLATFDPATFQAVFADAIQRAKASQAPA